MALGQDHAPRAFTAIWEKHRERFVAGIGPAGAPSRVRAAEALRMCQSILDVGCGPGVFLTTLQLHEGGHFERPRAARLERYVGVDPVAEMLPWRGYSRAQVPDVEAEFHQGDAEDLPYGDGEFRGVLLRHVLEHLEDPIPALREALRVSSGMVVLVFSQWPRDGWKSILTDQYLGALRWSHGAPMLRRALEGASWSHSEEKFSPDQRGHLAPREGLWICRKQPLGEAIDQVLEDADRARE